MPKRVSKKLKQAIAERAKFLCEYCKAPKAYSPAPFDGEHIVPYSLGGATELANLAFACNGCNGCKCNKTTAIDPVTLLEVLLFNPRTQIWEEQFAWSGDGFWVQGITPTGRATVALLQLNRPELLNLRQLLSLIGKHPPQ